MRNQADRAGEAWAAVFEYSRVNRLRVISAAMAAIVVIAAVDLIVVQTVALGFLYIIPLVVTAGALRRWQIGTLAVVLSILREAGSQAHWSGDYMTRIGLVAAAFAGAALFVKELTRNRELALERVEELKMRQQLEQRLRHAQRLEAVGRLAGGIAHDFNNLLSVIQGFSDLALRQIETESGLWRDVEEIRMAAERAAALTRQLLEFSRRDHLQPKVLDLNTLVSDISRMLRRVIGEDIDLQLVLQPRVSRVRVDAGSIEQVIMNLVVNARDAMPGGGKLRLQTAEAEIVTPNSGMPPGIKPGRYVTLAVEDSGLGIERCLQEHMFEPFFTTKEAGKGTGLGLSTAYGIIKQNGGDIWFVTEKGKGTTFTIYLPPTALAGESSVPARKAPAAQPTLATILLVEDDDGLRELARELLVRNGVTVIEAHNGVEAMTLALQPSFHFDLLLTDVVMPGMNGPELASKLARHQPGLNVLFMSGYADPSLFPGGDHGLARTVLEKPFSEDALMRSVRAMLNPPPSGEPRSRKGAAGANSA